MILNYFAIFAAAIVSMVIGFLWYSPVVLGRPWMKLKGYTEKSLKEAQKKMGPKYALSFIGLLLSAYVLAWVLQAAQVITISAGMEVGALMWLGFVTTTQLAGWIFSDSKKELYFIDTGYQLICFIIMGAILTAWK